MQKFTSAATSINAAKLPAVYGKIKIRKGDRIIDYGCGKYTAHIMSHVSDKGGIWYGYDKYNQNDWRNYAALQEMKSGADWVVCSNVLNVIDDEEEIRRIVKLLCVSALKWQNSGKVAITVYEGDRSGIGRQSGPDQWQRNEPLKNYMRFIPEGFVGRVSKGVLFLSEKID